MSDWLAVGDETGNWDEQRKWDEQHKPGAFLGVALVMGRIEDWRAALAETLEGQRIQERLQAPPQHLPPAYRKSSSHHLMETFNCWKAQKLEGAWSLAEPGSDPLRREVFATLRWLAEHPRLVTLGLWLQGPDMRRDLFRSGDPAVALGRAYGLLATLALPFLDPADRLLVQPGLRSEDAQSEAIRRAAVAEIPHADARQPGDTRIVVSNLIGEGQPHHDAWCGSAIAHFEAGTLHHLRGLCAPLKQIWLPNAVLNAIADLGAGLLRLSCQPGTARFSLRRAEAWRNVVFHALPEVTA